MKQTGTDVDRVVIGLSVAGVGAALAHVARGRSAVLVDYPQDSATLRGSLRIDRTPLTPHPVSGLEFEDRALAALRGASVQVAEPVFLSLVSATSPYLEFNYESSDSPGTRTIRARSAVFAPNGSEPFFASPHCPRDFLGRGLSADAWSDASYYRKRQAAILGCGYRAVEQAAIAAGSVSTVTILCESGSLDNAAERLLGELETSERIQLRFGVQLLSMIPDAAGHLAQLLVAVDAERAVLDASVLFIAQGLVPDWSLWGGQVQAEGLIEQGRLVAAGIAAGIPYFDHGALYLDGMNAPPGEG